jgi:Mrp family chromosome partitioning ATPase
MGDNTQISALRGSLTCLYARKWIVLAATLSGIAVGVISNHIHTHYEACAQIQIDPNFWANPGADPNAAGNLYSKLDSTYLHKKFAELMRGKGAYKGSSIESIVQELDRGLRIVPAEFTNLWSVYFTARDPNRAAEWLDTYTEVAVNEAARQQEDAIKPKRELLRTKFDEVKKLLRAQQEQINSYLGDSDHAVGSASASPGGDLLKRAYDESVKKRTDEEQKLSRLEPYLLPDADLSNIPVFDFAPNLRSYNENIAQVQEALGKLWLEGRNEEELRELGGEMDRHFQDQLRTDLEKTAENLRRSVSSLETAEQNALNNYLKESSPHRGNSGRSQEVSGLQETSGNLSRVAAVLEEELNNTALLESRATSSVSITRRAAPDFHPISKLGMAHLLILGLSGMILSAGAFALCAAVKPKVKAVEEIQGPLQISMVGTLPGTGDFSLSEIRKSYDFLRVLLNRNAHRYRTVMISSSLPKEGKTTVALNLARTLAASGEPTVLLDLDFRKTQICSPPTHGELRNQSRIFSPVDGLNMRLETTDCPWLHMIVPAEAAQFLPFILGQPEIDKLIRYLRCRYDWVIIDTPSITSARDPIIVASLIDAVLFVIKHDFVGKKIVRNSIAALNQANAKIIGTVINDFGLHRSHYRHLGRMQNDTPVTPIMNKEIGGYAYQRSGRDLAVPAQNMFLYGDNVGKIKNPPVRQQYLM